MSEQQFLWNSLDGGENVFIKERGSDKIIHIKIIEGKYEFVAFMEKVNEQQATIDCLRQKKIKERKFVLDEKGIVEKISNESYPRINSDEKDNPVATLSCGNLLELVNLLNEQQAEIERLKKELEPKFEDNQETEVRECQFCGEFRTEYHEYEDYSWSAEDYCNAGHDLEDTDPNSCKDYWDDFD